MNYNFDEIIDRRGTDAIKYEFLERYFGKEDILPMWVADMDFRTPDFIMEAIRKRAGHEILGYSQRPESFFNSVINWYKKRQGWEIDKESILFSPGIVAALSMAVKTYSNEGDKVIVQSPVYHPFFSVVKENKRTVLYNPLIEKDGYYKMDIKGLKEKLDKKVKLLLLSHPHNPVGRSWTEPELKEITETCLENNIIIISDEIHSDLVFAPNKHLPLCTLDKETRNITVACVAASKTFNIAGLSSSVLVIPNEKLRSAFNCELSTGHFHMGNIFGNVAMEAAYSRGHKWLDELLDYLKGNLEFLDSFIRKEIPAIRMYPAEATYLSWIDMRSLGMNNKQLKDFMIREAGIACNDGPSFGPGGDGFQRLNFGCPRSVLKNALVKLRDAVNRNN